jgi:hypothetical protein
VAYQSFGRGILEIHRPHRIDQAPLRQYSHTARSTGWGDGTIESSAGGQIPPTLFFTSGADIGPRPESAVLLLAVLLRMSLACMLSVIASVGGVTVGAVGMMRRFLVMPTLVVFSCLSMVPRSF